MGKAWVDYSKVTYIGFLYPNDKTFFIVVDGVSKCVDGQSPDNALRLHNKLLSLKAHGIGLFFDESGNA